MADSRLYRRVSRAASICFAVRVYFEDTDVSGRVVYHSILFAVHGTRAQSDMLRLAGDRPARGNLDAWRRSFYAVAAARHLRYPGARRCSTTTCWSKAGSAAIERRAVRPSARRLGAVGPTYWCEAEVTAAFLVVPNGRPKRQPGEWVEAYSRPCVKGKTSIAIDHKRKQHDAVDHAWRQRRRRCRPMALFLQADIVVKAVVMLGLLLGEHMDMGDHSSAGAIKLARHRVQRVEQGVRA